MRACACGHHKKLAACSLKVCWKRERVSGCVCVCECERLKRKDSMGLIAIYIFVGYRLCPNDRFCLSSVPITFVWMNMPSHLLDACADMAVRGCVWASLVLWQPHLSKGRSTM